MKVIYYLTPQPPEAGGHGGSHRSYQILYDLQKLPDARVEVISPPPPAPPRKASLRDRLRLRSRLLEWRSRIRNGLGQGLVRALDWMRAWFAPQRFVSKVLVSLRGELTTQAPPFLALSPLTSSFQSHFEAHFAQQTPDLVVFDYPGWSQVVGLCKSRGIPTIVCPQNLESLLNDEHISSQIEDILQFKLKALVTEIRFYQTCDRTLFISKVEAGLLQGLGVSCSFYPYQPLGQILQRLQAIARSRATGRGIERGLCLLIGSCNHPPIGASLRWFIQNANEHGLPEGIRVVVAGKESQKLAVHVTRELPIQFAGWLEASDLDQLLQKAHCALVPQLAGFGGLTRLIELPVAGIPVLASSYATLAVGGHPLVLEIENRWHDWHQALQSLVQEAEVARIKVPLGPDGFSALQRAAQELLERQ